MSLPPADTTPAALPPLASRQAAKSQGASAPGAGTSGSNTPAAPPAPALGVASVSHLADKLAEYLSPADLKKVKEAYRFSDEMHLGQMRRSGEPYISHPIAVAEICADWKLDAQAIMAALLHDAAEAYLGDMVKPLKVLMPEFAALEDQVTAIIAATYGIDFSDYAPIKRADLIALATEKRDLMPHSVERWAYLDGIAPLPGIIVAMDPGEAKQCFLRRFHELHGA